MATSSWARASPSYSICSTSMVRDTGVWFLSSCWISHCIYEAVPAGVTSMALARVGRTIVFRGVKLAAEERIIYGERVGDDSIIF